jgi:2-polyprenyl-6-hydroxyphenyl methylase / 3-demethylubiquinone-9 3-methyltransferase
MDLSEKKSPSTINEQGNAIFNKSAASWWDPKGDFKVLHRLNPVRLSFIRSQIIEHFKLEPNSLKPFEGLKCLDIGCGGGLISEPMTRMGASMTALESEPKTVQIAKDHAETQDLSIDYQLGGIEDLEGTAQFDVILALEVIEHVDDTTFFIKKCIQHLKPHGLIILSTLNRTFISYALGIIAAEHILKWVPKGTHDHQKFLKPSELAALLRQEGLKIKSLEGLFMNPLTQKWSLSHNISMNYISSFCFN